jgi:hypothetical protein
MIESKTDVRLPLGGMIVVVFPLDYFAAFMPMLFLEGKAKR